jgi:hypothetical protein
MPVTFSPEKRYVFNNWTKEDFTGSWGGSTQIIKAGETKELQEYLAFHYTKHLVNREMMRDGKDGSMSSEEARAPYENKTMAEIGDGIDSPALASLKEKIRAEIEGGDKVEKKSNKKLNNAKAEFADLK